MGALIAGDHVAEPFLHGKAIFNHGFTFGGHPVASAVALANIEVMEREGLCEHVREQRAGAARDARGAARPADRRRRARRGLLPGDRAGQGPRDEGDVQRTRSPRSCCAGFLSGELYRRGLICRTDDRGEPVIQLSPPLIAGPEQFEEIEAILRPVLSEAWERIARRMRRGGRIEGAREALRASEARTAGAARAMLTVEGLVASWARARERAGAANAHVRWVHSTELLDPTPWLRGGSCCSRPACSSTGAKAQRELVAHLAEHEIGGLGFGTGFAHKRLPAALADEARKRSFPLFEVPYELPFIAITERVFAQLLDERYEMLQRSMAGDVLAEALTGRLYPEELQARLRPFGIGERAAVLAFAPPDPAVAAPLVERMLARGDSPARVAGERHEPRRAASSRSARACCARWWTAARGSRRDRPDRARPPHPHRADARVGGEVRASASRVAPTQSLRLSFHEARCALEAVRLQNGNGAEVVASYADLGAFQLLLSLQDDDALLSYCRGVLGPVEAGEGEYGDELLRSLDVFIEHNGHWEKAANALYCHRHTLRYRIRRVEQLTGRDFSTARDRIEFWLALRGRELAR